MSLPCSDVPEGCTGARLGRLQAARWWREVAATAIFLILTLSTTLAIMVSENIVFGTTTKWYKNRTPLVPTIISQSPLVTLENQLIRYPFLDSTLAIKLGT